MPADDGGRADDQEGVLPAGPVSRQPGPEYAVPRTQPGPGDRPPQDGQLLTQGQVLQDESAARQQVVIGIEKRFSRNAIKIRCNSLFGRSFHEATA